MSHRLLYPIERRQSRPLCPDPIPNQIYPGQVCGWLKDRFGVSWQVTPTVLEEMLQDPDKEKVERVTNAFLKMKKFDIEELKKAFEGR